MSSKLNKLPTDIKNGINQSNNTNFKQCSLCPNKYSSQHKALIFKPCNHIICDKCCYKVNSTGCEICGKPYSTCDYAPNEIQEAITEENIGILLRFTVQNMVKRGTNYNICKPSSTTLKQLVDCLVNQKGVEEVRSFIINSKTYDMSQDRCQTTTLASTDLQNNSIIKCIERTKGGS